MRLLSGLAVSVCLLLSYSSIRAAPVAPAAQASINEITFPDARVAQQFKEKVEALRTGGLFKDLQLIVAGNVVAVIGEAAAVNREMENLQRLAKLLERAAQSNADPLALGNGEVVMSDARSALALKEKLDKFKNPKGAPQTVPGLFNGLEFLPSGNVLMVVGDEGAVKRDLETIRRVAFFFERPRAHLQLNLRVVQISGRDKAEVTQMSDAVRDMVEAQRGEIVRTFGLLQRYIEQQRPLLVAASPASEKGGVEVASPAAMLTASIALLLPSSRLESKPMSLPEMLVRLSLNRITTRESQRSGNPQLRNAAGVRADDVAHLSLVAFAAMNSGEPQKEIEDDPLLQFPGQLKAVLRMVDFDNDTIGLIAEDLTHWNKRVKKVRDDLQLFANRIERDARDADSARRLVSYLDQPECELPVWIRSAVSRSLDSTVRSFPAVAREHAQRSVREIARRYNVVATKADDSADRLKRVTLAYAKATGTGNDAREVAESELRRVYADLRSWAEDLVPAPLALFQDVDAALDTFSPPTEQLAAMFRDYTEERLKLESQAVAGAPANYAKLQSLESRLNRWLRRVSEVTARSLEEQFYQKYVKDVRLLADKRLNVQRVLETAAVERVPDVARDTLLSQRTVNIFISNSISLQFAPDTQNSVSATVQADLPEQSTPAERLAKAQEAAAKAEAVQKMVTFDPTPLLESLLTGGQPVNVKGGLSLQATPSVGYDAGSVTLVLSAQQTLDPSGSGNVSNRVAKHEVTNSTINALSYEPMVLSTLTSDITYYDEVGGIPGLRKTPILGKILNDLPGPMKRSKRQQGVFQASVIILEPVVIPTIEDLMNDHRGWRGKYGKVAR